MIHNKQKWAVLILCAVLATFACGCSAKGSLELPPLPTYSDQQPTPSPVRTAAPTPGAAPEPSAVPAIAAASPSPENTVPATQPSATAQPAPTLAPTPIPDPNVPVLSIEGATLPEDMLVYNVATLHGNVKTDKGIITLVNACILDANGNAVQDCYFTPMSASFSLAGTVNAQLRFAVLQPGYYSYVLTATADYNGNTSQQELINHGFAVYSDTAQYEEESEDPASGGAEYAAQITTDGSNAGQIWNFFAVYLDNPYGVAAVLANIDVESGCEPMRVQNDFTEGFMVSESFTIQIDENLIGRDGFMYSSAGEGYGPGYGLCQWSFERKGGLYDLAQERGTSVGDLDTQCMFIIMELEMQYPDLLETLKTTTDVRHAAREFFYIYEQGAEMGDRAGIAEDYLEKYGLVLA